MRKTSFFSARMDNPNRLACEVNRNGGQQQEPAEVI